MSMRPFVVLLQSWVNIVLLQLTQCRDLTGTVATHWIIKGSAGESA